MIVTDSSESPGIFPGQSYGAALWLELIDGLDVLHF